MVVKLKGLIISAVLAVFISVPAFADFTIDKSHTSISFLTKHFMTRVRGHFDAYTAEFKFDEKSPEKSMAKFVAKAASVNSQNPDRDKMLRSDNFFDVEKFPEVSFQSTKVMSLGDKKYRLEGDLTIKGIKKPVLLEVEYLGSIIDQSKVTHMGFEIHGKINRKDFGLIWNKFLDNGGVMIPDEVEIDIQVEATQK